jgi:hypothetical protein
VARVLDCETAGEAGDRGLERGVDGARRYGAKRLDSRDVDDAAAVALRDQHRQHRARAREHVREVDGIEIVPLGVGLLVERLARAAVVTDVVHQHVDPPVLIPRGCDQRVRRIRIADVANDRDRTFTDRDLRFACALGVDLAEDHSRAFGDESLDDAAADAGTAARHDRDLSGEERLHVGNATRQQHLLA